MELVEVPVVFEKQDRAIPGIAHGFAVENSPDLVQFAPSTTDPARDSKTQRFKTGGDPVFIFEALSLIHI